MSKSRILIPILSWFFLLNDKVDFVVVRLPLPSSGDLYELGFFELLNEIIHSGNAHSYRIS